MPDDVSESVPDLPDLLLSLSGVVSVSLVPVSSFVCFGLKLFFIGIVIEYCIYRSLTCVARLPDNKL